MDNEMEEPALTKEEKRRKRAEIDRQMAELAAEKAAMCGDISDSDAAPSPVKSPGRKRKSDVLAEASPVKLKTIIRDDSLTIRPLETKKLEFSKSLVNPRKSKAEFYAKSDKASAAVRHSQPHQASTSRTNGLSLDRQKSSDSGLKDVLDREQAKRPPSSRSVGTSGRHIDDRRSSLAGSKQQRMGTINLKQERENEAARLRGVKSESYQSARHGESSRLSESLASRRRQDTHGSDGEGSEEQKPFGKRDAETLTVLEKLETGPIEYGRDPEGMAEWTWVEPNSGLNLSRRYTSHSDVQTLMTSRYYLSPSKLYSVIRLTRDRQQYEVPLDSDWVTIAIVCGKSEIRNINGGNAMTHPSAAVKEESDVDDEDDNIDPSPARKKGKHRVKTEDEVTDGKKKTRKFVTLRLCSLSTKALRKGNGVSGDTLLTLLLFEAESESRSKEGDAIARHYRGGSGGAYEKWWKLDVGSVIGIVAPRVLKPWGKGNQTPNPHSHPLGLTPSSSEDIFLIGRSQDLGQCKSIKRDGNRCEDWVDKRVSQHCEYHVHMAVKSGKAGRAEFASSTAGFELRARTSTVKDEYDPLKKTGLLPRNGLRPNRQLQYDNNAGGQAYIVGGRIISGQKTAFADEFVHEKMGREKSRSLKRRADEKREEEALKSFLDKEINGGSTGAKYLRAIQDLHSSKDKGQKKATAALTEDQTEEASSGTTPFRAETVRKIGFNPAAYGDPLQGFKVSAETNKSLDELRGRIKGVPTIKLGKMPSKKMSNVVNPLSKRPSDPSAFSVEAQSPHDTAEPVSDEDEMIDLD